MKFGLIGCLAWCAIAIAAFGKEEAPREELAVDLGKGVKLQMVLIEPGSFVMGDDTCGPPHKVTISKPFYLGKYEVTEEEWQAVMGGKAADKAAAKRAMTRVSWDDCQKFLAKLNALAGKQGGKFVLPSEAQWEYASRAGSAAAFCYGDNERELDKYAWFGAEHTISAHPVGEKKPNAWGLYDMHGNVWEWCQDRYGDYDPAAATDPKGPDKGANRVMRGGGMYNSARECRSAHRSYFPPEVKLAILGLRVARIAADDAGKPKKPDPAGAKTKSP